MHVVHSPVSTFCFSECSCGCERLGGKESYCEQIHVGSHHLVPHCSHLLGVQYPHYKWKARMVRMLEFFISRQLLRNYPYIIMSWKVPAGRALLLSITNHNSCHVHGTRSLQCCCFIMWQGGDMMIMDPIFLKLRWDFVWMIRWMHVYPNPFEKLEESARYPLFVHALNPI